MRDDVEKDHTIINTSSKRRQGHEWNLMKVLLELSLTGLNTEDAARRDMANLAQMIFLLLLPHPLAAQTFFIHVFVLYGIIDSACADNILKMFQPGGVR